MPNNKLVVVLGPTATGKTKLAVGLADKFNGEVISADSRQVFRGMDLGTGKDLADYYICPLSVKTGLKSAHGAKLGQSGRGLKGSKKPRQVPYHLIDIISPKTEFNVYKYQKLAYGAIEKVQKQGKLPLLVGGTGLYINAVIKGYEFQSHEAQNRKYGADNIKNLKQLRLKLDKLTLAQLLARLKKIDPETYQKIDQKNRRRVQRALEIYYQSGQKKSEHDKQAGSKYDLLILGIDFPIDEITRRINLRLDTRLKDGMVKEIKKLHRQGVSWKRLDEFGLEYRYISRYLRGFLTYEQAIEELKKEIRRFAKRQLTWFKRNQDIIWLKTQTQAEKAIRKFLKFK